ncbi:hypothetical protein [Saccharolobus sp.]|uniref:hypothetical protein n=1 Tax=Saccharolobus sp. TaxID=2100761 RepID=UPI003175195D
MALFSIACEDGICQIICCKQVLTIEKRDLEPMLANIAKMYIADQLSPVDLFKMKSNDFERLYQTILSDLRRQIRERNRAEL